MSLWLLIILGLGLGLPGRVEAAAFFKQDGPVLRLGNGSIATTFNQSTGEWEALYGDGSVFANDLRCTIDANGLKSDTRQGERAFTVTRIHQTLGSGVRIEIERGRESPFKLILTMYDGGPFFLVQVRLPEAKGVNVREVTLPEGKLFLGDDPRQVSALVNYWNGEWYTEIQPVDLTLERNHWETYSHFFFSALNRTSEKSVILGALYAQGSNRIEADVDATPGAPAIRFKARCFYERCPESVAGEVWVSPPYFFGAPSNVLDGLELYGTVARAWRPVPLPPHPPTGWCSWDAGASDNQPKLFANIDVLKTNRMDEYGLRYIQLDDGWQQGSRCSGLWQPRPERFPAGMKGVAEYIQARGFVPGLWIGPFGEDSGQTNQTRLFANGKSGGYDLSSPAFKAYLGHLLDQAVRDWGFRYLKADFLTYGATRSSTIPYEDSFLSAVQMMHQALAPYNGYLLTCINHEWLVAGFTDGQRLGNDVHGGDLAGLYPTLKTWPRRYFSNNNFWIGDPDMLHVNLPTAQASQAWASFVALSGGATMLGDDLTRLTPDRVDILKKALPAQGITARPCDLWDRPTGWAPKFPRLWNCRVRKPGVGQWNVVGLFNWTVEQKQAGSYYEGEAQNITLDFARHLHLDPAPRYLVYDFWQQQYLGAFTKSLSLGLLPASCRVLVIHQEADIPQFLADDRHIISGHEALQQVRWNPREHTLSGLVDTVKNIPYRLALHIPGGYSFVRAVADEGPLAVHPVGTYATTLAFNTGPTGKVRWSAAFRPSAQPVEPASDSLVSRIGIPLPDRHAPEIMLRQLLPLWTDQSHDIEAGSPAHSNHPDLGTTAPFWIHWDISSFTRDHSRLIAEAECVGEGKIFFSVVGDEKPLFNSTILAKGERAPIDISVKDVKELTLICHYVDGWFSSVRGVLRRPRLVRQ